MSILDSYTFKLILFLILFFIVLILFYFFYKKSININNSFGFKNIKNIYFLKYIFLICSFFVILLSTFFTYNKGDEEIGKSSAIVFALDVSKSMNVFDINNNNNSYKRLDFAKSAIKNFVINNPNNSYGLVIFSGEAISSSPVTDDTNLFLDLLGAVDYKNLNIQGTNYQKAIIESNNRIKFGEYDKGSIILLSDGGDNSELNIEKIKDQYNNNNEYYFLGIGTNQGGKIILGKDIFGKYKYQMYNGDFVISKYNDESLRLLSDQFNGNYIKLNNIDDILSIRRNNGNIEFFNNKNYNKILFLISFILFIFYIFLLLGEKKLYSLMFKYEQEK